ncbi:FAS-associated factor 2-like [Patiria miniata]|uniref:UBX domain-containing protein n=1 Tax=Patiria miniata TaxID=46514 RepID=A0A913ZLB5_PATMI|nr:FAS-associated factor 2-like [Patiria miniata]XP_038052577.1 FAS-associated factor 2-like [Patiria miniata]
MAEYNGNNQEDPNASDAEITTEQTEKLIQFQDLTGNEDTDECRSILQRHNWNIETAVQDTLNVSEGRPTVFDTPSSRIEPPPPEVNTHSSDQRIYTVQRAHQRPSLLQWGYWAILFPFRFVTFTLWDILQWVLRFFRPDPRRIVTDPVGDVLAFIDKFNEQYGRDHPTFYQGTYTQALTDAKGELKFLLVYLHGDNHEDTPVFCRETLCNNEVTEFINTRMLFWAASTNTPEGYRVSHALREATYPFLALIVLRENKMTVVQRIEGAIEPQDLIARLTRVMAETEAYLVSIRHERQQRVQTNTLRQQQDEAYHESLRQDREKERRRQEEKDRKQRQVEEQLEREMEEQRQVQEREELKQAKASSLPSEPDPQDPNAIHVVVKLPCGTRLERCFLKTDPLQVVYDFVFIQDDAPSEFRLQTNYPRRVLPCQATPDPDDDITIQSFGLAQKEMIYVQDTSD